MLKYKRKARYFLIGGPFPGQFVTETDSATGARGQNMKNTKDYTLFVMSEEELQEAFKRVDKQARGKKLIRYIILGEDITVMRTDLVTGKGIKKLKKRYWVFPNDIEERVNNG